VQSYFRKFEVVDMGKGTNKSGQKHSHFGFKRRCSNLICKKRAEHKVGNKYYCRIHIKEL
jgi:hypothetical protein